MGMIHIELKNGNAFSEPADVLVLKYAQALYGVDAAAVEVLRHAGRTISLPKPWGFRLIDSVPAISASRVLFVGVPTILEFGYREIRSFARKALAALAGEAPETKHILITVHGPGYGLDEIEAFEAEIAGLVDAVRENDCPEALQRITIIERNTGRARRLTEVLDGLIPDRMISRLGTLSSSLVPPSNVNVSERLRSAGYASDAKGHVFVAMPFREEMDDIYHYGIQSAVKAAGYLCERADLSSFAGDILEWVRSRIESASLVVADLTDANPNVYLEVGYAWGVGVPTVLLAKSPDHLKFDVRGQRCLVYKKIKELEDSLTAELRALKR